MLTTHQVTDGLGNTSILRAKVGGGVEQVKLTAELLAERGTTHGSFSSNAHYGQALRDLFRSSPQWHLMPVEHREALDMMSCKLSRILSGQSLHRDHFDDIAGYAALAAKVCTK